MESTGPTRERETDRERTGSAQSAARPARGPGLDPQHGGQRDNFKKAGRSKPVASREEQPCVTWFQQMAINHGRANGNGHILPRAVAIKSTWPSEVRKSPPLQALGGEGRQRPLHWLSLKSSMWAIHEYHLPHVWAQRQSQLRSLTRKSAKARTQARQWLRPPRCCQPPPVSPRFDCTTRSTLATIKFSQSSDHFDNVSHQKILYSMLDHLW